MEKSNDGQVPDAAVEIYQMTREDLDDLLDQAREEAVLAINAMSQSSNSPPVSTGLGTSSMNLGQSVPSNSATSAGICTPPVSSGLGVMALNPGLPVTSGASRPAFKKAGLSRQYEFNAGVVAALASVAEVAPESVKASLVQVISQLSQRNELLVIADTDPEVFEFYDQHSRAETLQSSNPILAAFLRERKKKESKKPAPRSTMWKSRFTPPSQGRQPFRFGGASWARAPPAAQPSYQDRQERNTGRFGHGRPKDMCFNCGRFGHFAQECRAPQKH